MEKVEFPRKKTNKIIPIFILLKHMFSQINWDNYDQVLEVVKRNAWALEFASSKLRANETIVIEAVKRNAGALKFASQQLRANKFIVMEAVKQTGYALGYASEELRANESFVLEAVKRCGWALEFASEELRANESFVLVAVKGTPYALKFASSKLRRNETFIAECLYELYNLKKLEDIKCMWEYVSEEIEEKYENQWEPLMASYYHRIE